MADEVDLDRRIKELEAQLKEQELRDKASSRPLLTQSILAALPIVLTIGLGFLANYIQSQGQHEEELAVLERQGELEREKQGLIAQDAQNARILETGRTYTLQERDAKTQLERQEREFQANAAAAASRFTQEQLTLRSQHQAQQTQQALEFEQSIELQRRASEIELILKASEVPTSLTPEQQDIQRARNLLWFADAGYIRLAPDHLDTLRQAGRVAEGQGVPLPVFQSEGGTAGVELLAQFEGFSSQPVSVGDLTFIGHGHILTPEEQSSKQIRIGDRAVDISNGISEDDAIALLRQDAQRYYQSVDSLVKVPLTPLQRDALASFQMNTGALARSVLLRRLNNREYAAVPEELMKWTRAGGREMLGLRRRREAEIELWNRGSAGQ
ncbi:MAG TPA: lysozyme [Croceibacterium sp.]